MPMFVLSADVARAQGPGWTANATVIKLVVTGGGGINVPLSPDVTGCTSQSNYGPNFASIYPDHAGIDRMKTDLLVAFATEAVRGIGASTRADARAARI